MAFEYGQINFRGVTPQRENNGLPEGRHICRVGGAKLEKTASGGSQLYVELTALSGAGKGADRITVHHPDARTKPGAAKAVEIGKERIMAILTYGGHPNPEAHRSVAELNGLIVGVIFERDEDWVDNDGVTRKGGVKPRRNGAYYRPESAPTPRQTSSEDEHWGAAAPPLANAGYAPAGHPDNDIPF